MDKNPELEAAGHSLHIIQFADDNLEEKTCSHNLDIIHNVVTI